MDHITSEISLEELASIANLSCCQYKQKFKKQLGISPRHYINQQKIENAKILLMEGMSVTDVAMMLGFSTSGYFSTVFKKYTLYTHTTILRQKRARITIRECRKSQIKKMKQKKLPLHDFSIVKAAASNIILTSFILIYFGCFFCSPVRYQPEIMSTYCSVYFRIS